MSTAKTSAAAGAAKQVKPLPPRNGVQPKSILKKVSCTGKLTHNRRLTFHNKKKTKRIPNLNSMPEDILEDIWWSGDDYDDIMQSFEYTVFMMEAGEGKVVDDNEEHCTRGLELRTEAGKWARFEHKRDCYNAVLDEQDRQWNCGEDNQEKIANLCREVTAKTQRIACRKGMQDEQDIAKYVADTRSMLSKTYNTKKSKATTTSASNSAAAANHSAANGNKTLPTRTKSNSTGQLKRRTPRTDSGKARVEKSPPRKPERVLSGKSERGEVTPTNSASSGAPRTPKRSVSAKSSENSSKGSLAAAAANRNNSSSNNVTPTNSARSINVQRMPQRQSFSNSSNSTPARTSSGKLTSMAKKKIHLPKLPKRSSSNSSNASNASKTTDSSGNSSGPSLAMN